MKVLGLFCVATLAACGQQPEPREPADQLPVPSGPPLAQKAPEQPLPVQPRPRWEIAASGEGTALRLTAADGGLRLSIACVGSPLRLVANVPTFAPVGSEDRFALGLGSEPVTLVADPMQPQPSPGVTGEGPAPENLVDLLNGAEQITALYGSQEVGPYPPPPKELAEALGKTCSGN